jgi:hypothetical protein
MLPTADDPVRILNADVVIVVGDEVPDIHAIGSLDPVPFAARETL